MTSPPSVETRRYNFSKTLLGRPLFFDQTLMWAAQGNPYSESSMSVDIGALCVPLSVEASEIMARGSYCRLVVAA